MTQMNEGVTPLMRAAQRGEFKMVQMFIKRGASPFIVGPSGKASEVALQNNFPAVNEFLRRGRGSTGGGGSQAGCGRAAVRTRRGKPVA
jgi:ankyrin repeat protein